jgi:hypothetical protein
MGSIVGDCRRRRRGEWPKRARAAAQYLAAVTVTETDTADTDLLAAVRDAFGDDDRLGTEELASRLNGLPDSPWASWNKGNCIRPHNVSKTLKPYKIEPGAIRLSPSSDQKKRGYMRAWFEDAWERYLPCQSTRDARDKTDNKNNSVSPRLARLGWNNKKRRLRRL